MLYKIYRIFFEIGRQFCSIVRIIHLSIKYPSIKITGKSYIAKNCEIVCVDGGKMILNNVHINYNCFIFCENKAVLTINSSYIGMNSVIAASKQIIIHENCEIAEMVVIRDQNHKHNLSDTPISKQGLSSAPIIINKNVWIGAKATILKGVVVGKNSIIGANSLVNKNVAKASVVAGIPAKPIKNALA